ncbi:hypothetical protein GCM10008026_13580 [Chelatococcus composti]|nr:hypothetical protein GCM10008026_13580 [Chelatococcus composti]
MPQAPGPEMGFIGSMKADGCTSFCARQADSAWLRQASRLSNVISPQPAIPAQASIVAANVATLRAMYATLRAPPLAAEDAAIVLTFLQR